MKLSQEALGQIFSEARSHHAWLNQAITDDALKAIYDLAKWGPTSMNSSPMRILFLRSESEKERLMPALMGGNVAQVKAAPVTAVIAHDTQFYNHLGRLFPAYDSKPMFVANPTLTEITALRNSSLQGAYFMIAARSLGFDVGAMSGFDNAKVDEAFFKGTTWRSNFLCNLGHGDPSKLYPRGARLGFDEACKIV